jgi:hypothetical protein
MGIYSCCERYMSSLKNTEKPFGKWKAPEKSCKSVNILATHWKKYLFFIDIEFKFKSQFYSRLVCLKGAI